MPRKLYRERHDFVLLGESSIADGSLTVCMYLSDDIEPFMLGYGRTKRTGGSFKATPEAVLSGAHDEHIDKCGAQWVKAVARRLLERKHLRWEDLQQVYLETE